MHNARRQILMDCFQVFDLLLMVFSYALATVAVLEESAGVHNFTQFVGMRVKIENFAVFTGLVIAWHFILVAFGLYHSKRLTSRWEELWETVKATTTGSTVLYVGAWVFQIRMVGLKFIVVFWAIATIATVLSRLALRVSLHQVRRRGRNLRWMLIAGTNDRAVEFAKTVALKPELGYRILGFVDDEWGGTTEFQKTGFKRVCDFRNFPAFLRTNVVDELVIALPMRSYYTQASEIAACCEEQGLAVRHLSIFNPQRKPADLADIDYSLITHYSEHFVGMQMMMKRLLDITISLVVLVLCAPLLGAVALLIRLTSPGPVFFVQKRLGINKRRFNMYKFRTMVPDAEKKQAEIEHLNEASGSVFKIKNDPRITPIGKFLRKTSIDELPQLINVLLGDMSLVGPRPLPGRDYDRFDQDWQRRRFSVRPGITCLWQVKGRSSIGFDEWMKLDLNYIDQWSIWLDLEILIKTVPAVLRGSGAV
jgi:exopolysaccharide biosynthesis polyprenyl glycosylphosphotransferase